jgi:dGTPase
MSPDVLAAANTLRDFLFARVYNPLSALEETEKAMGVIRSLYRYFNNHDDKMPGEYRLHGNSTERSAVDYVAGMTDLYALRMAEALKSS